MKHKQKGGWSWRRIGAALMIMAPAFVLSALLAVYSVNVPFWDQWEFVTIIQKTHEGTLSFTDFFAQHNEHRILLPRLIMFALAFLTQWNTLFEVATNVLLAAAIFCFLHLIVRQTFANRKVVFVALVLTSCILFSPTQFENWMWGWQIQWFLNVLGAVIAIWALGAWKHKNNLLRFAVAAVGAGVATYSLASGIFVWLVCLPLLWFDPGLRKLFFWWVGAAVGVISSHYIGYQDPGYHPSKTLFLQQPVDFMHYLVVYIARPVVIDFRLSAFVAAAYFSTIIAAIVVLTRSARKLLTGPLLPWICLGLYSLFAAGSTAISRLGFGAEQAYSSRYITLSCLLLIAVCMIFLKIFEVTSKKRIRQIFGAVLVVIFLIVSLNWGKGALQIWHRHEYLIEAQKCAREATSAADPCLLKLYPNAEVLWPRLQYLRNIHWGGL